MGSRKTHSPLFYEAKVSISSLSLLATLVLPGYALLLSGAAQGNSDITSFEIIRAFELLLPLTAALVAAPLMAVEREAGIDDLRATYPQAWWWLPAVRTAEAVLLTAVGAALGMLVFQFGMGEYSLWDALLPSLSPTLLLGSLALLAGKLTGSHLAASGIGTAYWIFDLVSRGKYTKNLFLFAHTMEFQGQWSYGTNRWVLAGIGAALIAVNFAVALGRRR